jgi:uroporphyrinogen-III synthase
MPATVSAGCYVISLRPVGQHAALRRAAGHVGARLLALSSSRLVQSDGEAVRRQLRDALVAPRVVFTSPAAVRAALALDALRSRRGQRWFAVGSGTADALRRAGIPSVETPRRMDSEGLLALPGLQDVRGQDIGLVTAPGGRGLIECALAKSGAGVLRADVYRRVPVSPSPRAIATLRTLEARPWLALSSGEALEHVLASLPDDARAMLLRARVIAASERLARLAATHGFKSVTIAASARPRDLIAAAFGTASASMRAAAVDRPPQ